MFSCCSKKCRSKVARDDVDNAPYVPMVIETSGGDGSLLQTEKIEENQTLVTKTHLREGEQQQQQQQPMTHTVVKTKKSGNTVTVVKTTTSYSQVLKTESDDERNVTSDNDGRVYKTTVISSPTPKRKRFNLKSVLDRRVKRQISFREQDEQFHQQCLFAHNRNRLKHGAKPLILNKEMCKYATEWANHLAKKNIVQYRQKCKYGENLGLATGGTNTAEVAVKNWYDEIESYNFQRPGLSSRTDHFTQVVWKETTQLGVGVAQKDNRTWIVCNYDPPGNILNRYGDNVIAPKGYVVSKQSKLNTAISDKARIEGGQEEVEPSTSQGVKRVEGSNQISKFSKFELECLEAHNDFRKIHGCKPMTLSKELCNLATDWARHLAKIRCMHHRPHNDYGENIFQSINYDSTMTDAVKGWYDEIKNYKYSKPGFSSKTGHFTQIVWSDSTELGVGKAKVDNLTFIVCNYNPPGNVMTQYKTQVPPIGGFKDQIENGIEVDGKSQKPVNGVRLSLKPNNFFSAKWSKWTKRK